MTEIMLEECWGMRPDPNDHRDGSLVNTYLGKIVIDSEELTPERMSQLKADSADVLGWKKYHLKLKDAGYDVESA